MRSPWTRAAAIALTTAAVSALPLISGCKTDVERADEKASADMDTATIAMDGLHPEAAREALASTTSAKGQSPEAQIESYVLAAQADEQAAGLLMSGPGSSGASAIAFRAVVEGKAAPQAGAQSVSADERANLLGIEQRQILIAELLSRMNSLTRQVAINNGNVAGYRALDPAAARQKLQQATTAAQKGDKGVWVPGTAPMASLEALKASEQDLQKQIADLTAKRNDLNAKRGQALQDASKFGQQADSTTGTQSVGFFTQAANQRKDASDDETKMAQLDSQIAPLQQDLNLVQTQEKAIGDIVTSYADQTQQLENGWKDLQRRIDEASALSKNLLERAESGASASTAPSVDSATGVSPAVVSVAQMPQSLAGLSAALDVQTKEAQALRSKVVSLLNDANRHYESASGIAATLTKSLTVLATGQDAIKLPERRAWQERIALNSPAVFKLHQAGVQDRLARLYADQYAELAMRNRVLGMLAAALKQGGLTAPASLASAIPADTGVPAEVDSKVKQYQGDLKSDQPPFDKDASELSELSAAQTSPVAQQAVVATQADLAYHWSANRLNDVIANAGQGDLAPLLINIAHASLMSTEYAQSQFAALQGKDPESQADLKAALDERRALVDASAQNMLPATLPPGLAFEAKPVSPAGAPTSVASVPGPGATTGPTVGAEATSAAQAVAFPTFGIAFTAPQDATVDSPTGSSPGYVATYHLAKPSPAAGAMVIVERLASEGSNAQQLAASIAAKTSAAVDPGTFTIGGEEARKLTATIHEGEYTSRTAYVTVHGNQGYLLSAVSTPQSPAEPALEALIKTVAFTPPDPPAKHLDEFLSEPFTVWGFAMNGPSCLRRVEASDSDVHLGIYDFSGKTMTNPLNLDFQHIVVNAPKTFADLRDTYSAAIQKQLGLTSPFVWHEQPGVPGLNVSDPVKVSSKAESGESVSSTQRLCVLQVAPGDFTQILFSLSQMPDADATAFAAVEDRMLASIKVSAANPPGSATTTPTGGTTPPPDTASQPSSAPAPAPGTTPPAEGTTPPATAPAPAAGTTPPAEGTPPPASAPAPGATQPGQ